MRKFLDNVKTFGKNKDGVVSFEYIIVATAIIAVVGVAFSRTGPLSAALSSGIAGISSALTTATTAAPAGG